jgi:hypothetical protein
MQMVRLMIGRALLWVLSPAMQEILHRTCAQMQVDIDYESIPKDARIRRMADGPRIGRLFPGEEPEAKLR